MESRSSQLPGELFASNQFVREICDIGELSGLPREEFARRINLPLKSIETDDGVLAQRYIPEAFAVLVNYTNDESIGVGRFPVLPGTCYLAAKLACTEQTLGSAIQTLSDFYDICRSPVKISLSVNGLQAHVQISIDSRMGQDNSAVSPIWLAMVYRLINLLLKKEIRLLRAHFCKSPPKNIFDYEFLFNCPIFFSQPHIELVFDHAWLSRPIKAEFSEIARTVKEPHRLLYNTPQDLGIVRQIKDYLSIMPCADYPDQKVVAEHLRMSVRTLQRRLESEQSSYKIIKDNIRRRKAVFYIENTQRSLSEIADKCGFSEVASFSRAFNRWTGLSPSQYKNELAHIHS